MKRIMVVDDQPNVAEVMMECLRDEGYEVIFFDDPLRARGHLVHKSHEVDLLITDFRMPRITGPELLASMRVSFIKTPAILITASISTDGVKHYLERGFSDVFIKPYDLELLLKSVNRILAK